MGLRSLTSEPDRFTPGKEPRQNLIMTLDGRHSRSSHFGENKT